MGSSWQEATLGELVEFQRGFDLPVSDRHGGSVPVVASTGPVGWHDEAKVDGPGVVIGRSGSIGGGQYIEGPFWPLNTTLWAKDFRGNDPQFVYYFVRSLQLERYNAGSGVPTLNRNHIHPLPVRFPEDVTEQRAIAEVLGSLDDKIALNRRMNRTLESIARALFRHRFLDHPDPAWEERALDEIAEVAIGKTPPRKQSEWFTEPPEGLPWVSIRDMGGAGVFLDQTRESLTHQAVETHRVKEVPPATVLLSFKLTVGRVVITQDRATTNEAIAHLPLRDDSPVGRFYLFCYLRNFDFSSLGSTSSIATAVNSKTIKCLPITIPNALMLKQFEDAVLPVFAKIKLLQSKSRTLAALRDALLPRLLSGELPATADRGGLEPEEATVRG